MPVRRAPWCDILGPYVAEPLPNAAFLLSIVAPSDYKAAVRKVPFPAFALLTLLGCDAAHATTKRLNQIVTPDLQSPGDVSISAQVQSERIGNPYEAQLEIGLVKWAEVAVFKGFKPNELIFGTELGLLQKEPWLLSIGAINWSPHSHVDPQPFIEAGYYTEHNKFIVGAIRAGSRNEAILGWAYDFN